MTWGERRRAWRKSWKKRREVFELLGSKLAMWGFQRLPDALVRRLGRGLGRLGYALSRKHRRQALDNLAHAYPEWSSERRKQVAQQSFIEFALSIVEWFHLGAASGDEIAARVEVVGLEHLQAAVGKGRGVFVVTAHFGNWELMPHAARPYFPDQPFAVVGRVFRNQALYAHVIAQRSRGGVEVIGQSALAVRRALRKKAIVGILLDQYMSPRHGGQLVPFFGRRAWSAVGPALLAHRLQTPVLPVHILPVPGGRHRLVIGPEIELCQQADEKDAVLENARRFAAAIEAFIRERPENWLWLHHRWRHSPDS